MTNDVSSRAPDMKDHISLSTLERPSVRVPLVADLRQELGRRIAAARHEAGFTQRELAQLVGLRNASDISRYERGEVDPPYWRLERIAKALGHAPSYFVRSPDEPEPETLEDLRREIRDELAAIRRDQAAIRLLAERLLRWQERGEVPPDTT